MSADDFQFLLQAFKDELLILIRVMYKVKNQQRRTDSFRHLQGLVKSSKKLLKGEVAIVPKIREEAGKAGLSL
jgi:hypothetical protein